MHRYVLPLITLNVCSARRLFLYLYIPEYRTVTAGLTTYTKHMILFYVFCNSGCSIFQILPCSNSVVRFS